ncbi:oligosaccharide repeat unit polymerase [Enterobacter sichuanensis]|uniref:oligosaccharide repeat unit polymerase n=1 Tax=Enterobacter sichuanensis TaxID=2071710 RepID=UPI0021CEB4FE|nr:oligosaccharide repeat unit polymerase [Enterobacter sichuanensis]MCU6424843.1 oligosaccharide repeat unit polymerase [Enterobacter sichuanensis]
MTRKYLFTLYVFLNISCALYFGVLGLLGGDFKYEYPADSELLLLSLLIVLFTFVLLQKVIFNIFENIPVKATINLNDSYFLDCLVFAIVIIGLFSSIFFSVGVLGASKDVAEDAPKLIFYFNSFFQPSLFVLIYLFYRYDSTRFLYYANFILYIILILVSGQTGQILLLFCLFLIRKKNPLNFFQLCILTLLGIGLYPFVRIIKDAIVQSVNAGSNLIETILTAMSNIDLDIYFSYLFITLERFQSVSNIHYLIQNGERLSGLFDLTGSTYSFFSLYWLVSAFLRMFGLDLSSITSAQDFTAISINGVSTWSSQIGVFGYIYFHGVYSAIIFLSMMLVLFFCIRMSKMLNKNNAITNLTWFMSLLLICHGWFIPFYNYAQALLIFLGLVLTLNAFKMKHKAYGS